MKRTLSLLVMGIVLLYSSGAAFAQSFSGGGYAGPVLEPISISDLADAAPNEYVIVSGILAQERVPGKYVLVDGEDEEQVSVLVRIGPYEWVNLEIDDETPVLIYGIVLKSQSSIEILAERIGLLEEE